MGLNNTEMAHTPGDRHGMKNHAAFNADVFLRQRPDLFLPMTRPGEPLRAWWRRMYRWHNGVLKGLLEDERFRRAYGLAIVSDHRHRVITCVAKDFLDEFRARGLKVEMIEWGPAE